MKVNITKSKSAAFKLYEFRQIDIVFYITKTEFKLRYENANLIAHSFIAPYPIHFSSDKKQNNARINEN
jgi:hypothetical protein